MKRKTYPTKSEVEKRLEYNPSSGVFVWKKQEATTRAQKIANRNAGREAGIVCDRGYRYIKIRPFGMLSASRLAWILSFGFNPAEEIDHIDGNPSNNQIYNLRIATRSQNAANRGTHSNSKVGQKGITRKGSSFAVCVALNKKRHRVNGIKTLADAIKIRNELLNSVHGEFARK